MSPEDKPPLIELADRMPTGAPRHDLARERAGAGNWIFGDLSRLEFHRLARDRARVFVRRLLPLFEDAKTNLP